LHSLDVIDTWMKIHEEFLTRYQSKKYFGFTLFLQSQDYAKAFQQILSLTVPT